MAKTDLKGLTVEINGDSTGLLSALKGIDSQLTATSRAIRETNNLLKFDSSSTEALELKQASLARAIETTRDRLQTLQQASEEAKQKLEIGEISEQQYEALQREILKTEQNLDQLEQESKDTQKALEGIDEDVEEVSEKFEKGGEAVDGYRGQLQLLAGQWASQASGAIFSFLGDAYQAYADLDEGILQVIATLGQQSDAMVQVGDETVGLKDYLTDLAKEMSTTTRYSATEAADGLNYMALAGYNLEEITTALPSVMALATAGAYDLGTASDQVTDIISAMGLSVDDVTTLVDQMAFTSTKTNTDVEGLGNALLTVGASAKVLSGGTAEASAAIGVLASSGIKGSEAGTKLRNIIVALQSPTDAAAKTLEELGIQVYDQEGNFRALGDILGELSDSLDDLPQDQRDEAINNIFNKTDLAAVNTLLDSMDTSLSDLIDGLDEDASAIDELGFSFQTLQADIENSQGAAQQMSDTALEGLNAKADIAKNQFSLLGVELIENFAPIIGTVIEYVGKLAEWFANLPEPVKTVITVIATVAAAFLAVAAAVLLAKGLFAIFSFTNIIGGMTSFVSTLVTKVIPAVASFAVTLLANPMTWIIAAVLALVAVGIYLYQHWDEIKEYLAKIWDNIKTKFQEVWDKCKEAILGFISNCFEWGKSIITKIIEGISSIISSIQSTVESAGTYVYNGLKNIITSAYTWGRDLIQGFIDGIKSKVSAITDAVKGIANTVKSWLGFSRPDEGPLHYYEEWMPDFMKGLAKGIEESKYLVEDEIKALTEDINNLANVESDVSLGVDYNRNQTPAAQETQAAQTTTNSIDIVINLNNVSMNSTSDIRQLSQQLQRDINRNLLAKGVA